MPTELQSDLFSPSLQQQFDVWKATPGGAHVLRHAYRIASTYAARWTRTGQRVSVRLIWETLRDRVAWIRRGLKARGQDLQRWGNFRLNDHFHAYVARHMMERRPEWRGLFETRELAAKRKSRKIIVITDFPTADNGQPQHGINHCSELLATPVATPARRRHAVGKL